MTVGELKKALEGIDDKVDVRVHVSVKGDLGGHCLVIESAELEDFDKDVDNEFIIEAKQIVLTRRDGVQ